MKSRTSLAEATTKLTDAQAYFNQVIAGYGADSKQARDRQVALRKAQGAVERAGYDVEESVFAVSEAEKALAREFARHIGVDENIVITVLQNANRFPILAGRGSLILFIDFRPVEKAVVDYAELRHLPIPTSDVFEAARMGFLKVMKKKLMRVPFGTEKPKIDFGTVSAEEFDKRKKKFFDLSGEEFFDFLASPRANEATPGARELWELAEPLIVD
jgi:hypothetical protein